MKKYKAVMCLHGGQGPDDSADLCGVTQGQAQTSAIHNTLTKLDLWVFFKFADNEPVIKGEQPFGWTVFNEHLTRPQDADTACGDGGTDKLPSAGAVTFKDEIVDHADLPFGID